VTRRLGALSLLAALAAPAVATAQPAPPPCPPAPQATSAAPDRSGVTFELGLGLAMVRHDKIEGPNETSYGAAGPGVTVGYFATRDLALGVRFTAAVSSADVVAYLGPSLQYWIGDQIFVGGGVGGSFGDGATSWGADARIGHAFHVGRGDAFYVAAEVNGGTYPVFEADGGGSIIGFGVQIGWQSL